MKVLVTRAEPAASRTCTKLAQMGHEPILFPIFDLVDTGISLPEKKFDGMIFTSANAVEVLDQRGWRNTNSEAIACCVGKRTWEAVQKLGFNKCITASGGGAALCEEIAKVDLNKELSFLYPTTPDRSFDMQTAMKTAGYRVEQAEIYQTKKLHPSKDEVRNAIETCINGAILIYSARSSAHLGEILQKSGISSEVSTISLIGIAKTATNKLLNYSWRKVYVSEHPSEDAMLRMLDDTGTA